MATHKPIYCTTCSFLCRHRKLYTSFSHMQLYPPRAVITLQCVKLVDVIRHCTVIAISKGRLFGYPKITYKKNVSISVMVKGPVHATDRWFWFYESTIYYIHLFSTNTVWPEWGLCCFNTQKLKKKKLKKEKDRKEERKKAIFKARQTY